MVNLKGKVAVVTGAAAAWERVSRWDMGNSESPEFIGRVVAGLANDPNIMKRVDRFL